MARNKCVVSAGPTEGSEVLECCDSFEQLIDYHSKNKKAKGVQRYQMSSVSTGEMTRDLIVLRHPDIPNGLCANFCPICGQPLRLDVVEELAALARAKEGE